MKNRILITSFTLAALLLAGGMTGCVTEPKSESPPTLKAAYKHHFYVGVAINRTIATSTSVRADNVNRSMDQIDKNIALVKEQFNQISPENDLKWALIQPNPGPDGYNFGPADAYVNFGLSNHMYIVGHTPGLAQSDTELGFRVERIRRQWSPTGPLADANAGGTNVPSRGRGRSFGGGGFGGFNMNGPHATREELLQRMHDHIMTVVGIAIRAKSRSGML